MANVSIHATPNPFLLSNVSLVKAGKGVGLGLLRHSLKRLMSDHITILGFDLYAYQYIAYQGIYCLAIAAYRGGGGGGPGFRLAPGYVCVYDYAD